MLWLIIIAGLTEEEIAEAIEKSGTAADEVLTIFTCSPKIQIHDF